MTQTYNDGQIRVLERVATGAPMAQILRSIVEMVEGLAPGMLCSLELLDREKGTLHYGAAPSLPQSYNDAVEGAQIGPGAGSCGTAAFTGQRVIVEDIATHPYWSRYRDVALSHGLRACWSTPITTADRQVLGTFAMYYREPRSPTAREFEWVDRAIHLAAIAITRAETERSLRESEARAQRLVVELGERVDELAFLYALGERLSGTTRREQVLELALPLIAEYLGAARCAYAEVTEHDGWVVISDHADGCRSLQGPQPLSLLMPGKKGPSEPIRGPLVVGDVQAELTGEEAHQQEALGVKALVCCPVVSGQQLLALLLVHANERRTWKENHVRVVQAAAERCWTVIEQRSAEAKLEQNATLLRIAERAARLGGWSVELPEFRVIWSDEVCAIHEVPSGTRPDLEAAMAFYPDEDRQRLREVLEACANDGSAFDIELEFVTSSGARTWVRNVGHAERDADGHIVRIQGALQDVGERRTLEDQLRQSQKLEAVGRLAGGVAHDFNNLLSVILSYSSIAAGNLHPDSEARRELEEITKAGQRASALTRQLLAFSRHQVLRPQAVNLNEVLVEIEGMLRRVVGEDVNIRLKTRSGVGQVFADQGQLEQVILNLVINARDAMPSGGDLTLETSSVVLDENYARARPGVEPGPYVVLTVSDTGSGMDAATRAKIFEPFFTTKSGEKGSGLGLATVWGIVTQSNGYVTVDSAPNEGSSFMVYLPHVDCEADARAPARAPRKLSGSETVLLVEDDQQVRHVMRTILRNHGYEVLEAEDGPNAVKIAGQHGSTIDLLLSDVVMPRMRGTKLAEQLLEQHDKLKLLFVSGYAPESVRQNGILKSGAAFLHKPFTPEALLRTVREVLDDRTSDIGTQRLDNRR